MLHFLFFLMQYLCQALGMKCQIYKSLVKFTTERVNEPGGQWLE